MIQPANLSSPLGVLQGIENPNVQHLTNEGMMIYLSTRLEGIDTQIDAIFKKQENIEKVRDALTRLNTALEKRASETPDDKIIKPPRIEPEREGKWELPPGETDLNKEVLVESPESIAARKAAPGWDADIQDIVNEIQGYDPNLGAELRGELQGEGQILSNDSGGKNNSYTTKEVATSQSHIKGVLKKLENSAQLEMIGLQSLMSSRQTAVQLSTNMVAAYGESLKAQVAKIG